LVAGGVLDAFSRKDRIRYFGDRERPLSLPQHVQGLAEQGATLEPRIRFLPAPDGNGSDVVLGIENPNDGLDAHHGIGEALGLFPVL